MLLTHVAVRNCCPSQDHFLPEPIKSSKGPQKGTASSICFNKFATRKSKRDYIRRQKNEVTQTLSLSDFLGKIHTYLSDFS